MNRSVIRNFEDFSPRFFIGRESEINTLSENLIKGNIPIASITGSPGVGKSALAMQFVHLYRNFFTGGVYSFCVSPVISISEIVLSNTNYTKEPALIIVDEIDRIPTNEICNEVDRIIKLRPNTRVILISISEVEIEIPNIKIHLNNLSYRLIYNLIHEYAHLKLSRELDEFTIEELASLSKGNILTAKIALDYINDGVLSIEQLIEALKPFKKTVLVDSKGNSLSTNSKEVNQFCINIKNVSYELLLKLNNNPKLLYSLTPRKFEEVVAELFYRMGYDVTITQMTRDGGKDIYVAKKNELGSFLYIVECKKYSPDRTIGVGFIRELYGVVQAERATA